MRFKIRQKSSLTYDGLIKYVRRLPRLVFELPGTKPILVKEDRNQPNHYWWTADVNEALVVTEAELEPLRQNWTFIFTDEVERVYVSRRSDLVRLLGVEP